MTLFNAYVTWSSSRPFRNYDCYFISSSSLVVVVLTDESTVYVIARARSSQFTKSLPWYYPWCCRSSKMSPVWDFRVRVSENKMSACEVIRIQLVCWRLFAPPPPPPKLPGKYRTNLKGHLKAYHRVQYEEVLERQEMTQNAAIC